MLLQCFWVWVSSEISGSELRWCGYGLWPFLTAYDAQSTFEQRGTSAGSWASPPSCSRGDVSLSSSFVYSFVSSIFSRGKRGKRGRCDIEQIVINDGFTSMATLCCWYITACTNVCLSQLLYRKVARSYCHRKGKKYGQWLEYLSASIVECAHELSASCYLCVSQAPEVCLDISFLYIVLLA